MAELLMLNNVRLSFPQLVEPRASTANPEAVKKYSADFIMTPDHPGFAAFMRAFQTDAVEKWKEHAQQVMTIINSDRKLRCYAQGAEKINFKTFEPYDGYEGMVAITANNVNAPQMIKADGKPTENTMEYQQFARKLYGGCYVNAVVKPWLQENKHGRGVRCDLVAIQFCADGEAFGEGSTDASSLFGAVATPAAAAPAMPGFPSFMGQ